MREKELQISDIPGDYLSKEDFYKIAHISKRAYIRREAGKTGAWV